jgi:hypothetical protein
MNTRFRLRISSAVAGGLLLGGAAFGAEALRNSSFEDPVDAGLGYNWTSDRAVFWERWGGWFNRETTWAPVMSGQCMMAYHHWRIQGDETSGIFQDIGDVPAGKPYTFSVKVMKDKGANADYVEIRLESYLGGQTLASKVFRMSEMKGGKWMPISVTGISPNKGIRVLVVTKPGRATERKGALKFDDASLIEETNPAALATLNPAQNNNAYGLMRKK